MYLCLYNYIFKFKYTPFLFMQNSAGKLNVGSPKLVSLKTLGIPIPHRLGINTENVQIKHDVKYKMDGTTRCCLFVFELECNPMSSNIWLLQSQTFYFTVVYPPKMGTLQIAPKAWTKILSFWGDFGLLVMYSPLWDVVSILFLRRILHSNIPLSNRNLLGNNRNNWITIQ